MRKTDPRPAAALSRRGAQPAAARGRRGAQPAAARGRRGAQPVWVPLSRFAGTAWLFFSALNSWVASVLFHSTESPAAVWRSALATGTVPVCGLRSASATWIRSYRWVPWSTESEPAALEPNGSARNGLRTTLGLVALLSRALRN